MLLETRRLCKSFGSLKAADGIDLGVAAGEAVGIIGPNGAGKSTLFNLIAGNLAADSGVVLLEGKDITRLKAHRRCAAGIGRSYQIPLPLREPHRVREPAGGRRARPRQIGRRRHRCLRRHPRADRAHRAAPMRRPGP